MQRGDFDNLPGRGKPLDNSDYNPFIDLTTHNINKILVNNGFKPEWIMLSKEIRDDITVARGKLAVVRERLGPPPFSDQDNVKWTFHVDKFKASVQEINTKINKFNFIVPFMENQMVHYNIEGNIEKVINNPSRYIQADANGRPLYADSVSMQSDNKNENTTIQWKEVWSNIKQVFTVR
uniref:DnaJ homologue subfamily C member 28 conserved domain-containing protein n=1 Tax=Arion vulgaris TaxID=1028688 RepID=A0A0B7AJK8_9EUPU